MPAITLDAPAASGLARAAHWYAARGWHVFPLVPGTKRPAVDRWETTATTDPAAIEQTWSRDPFNIGIATGPSGLLVLDLDQPKGPADTPSPPWDTQPGIRDGADVLAALCEAACRPFPFGTYMVATCSGGLHLYFSQPTAAQLRNTTGRLGWKIDTRGHGGYVVAAGSVVDDRRYTTLHAIRPAPLPDWLRTALTRQTQHRPCRDTAGQVRDLRASQTYAHAALRGELDRVLNAANGERNNTLNTAAYALGQLVAAHLLDRGQVETALAVAAAHIGLTDAEAARTIASGLDSGADHPRRTA
jgi:hypothetical protein